MSLHKILIVPLLIPTHVYALTCGGTRQVYTSSDCCTLAANTSIPAGEVNRLVDYDRFHELHALITEEHGFISTGYEFRATASKALLQAGSFPDDSGYSAFGNMYTESTEYQFNNSGIFKNGLKTAHLHLIGDAGRHVLRTTPGDPNSEECYLPNADGAMNMCPIWANTYGMWFLSDVETDERVMMNHVGVSKYHSLGFFQDLVSLVNIESVNNEYAPLDGTVFRMINKAPTQDANGDLTLYIWLEAFRIPDGFDMAPYLPMKAGRFPLHYMT